MQKYRFVEGVDEAWMEFADRAERAYDIEMSDDGIAPDLYLASEADAEIAKLKAALRKYGGHLELCERLIGSLCTCGLSTVL